MWGKWEEESGKASRSYEEWLGERSKTFVWGAVRCRSLAGLDEPRERGVSMTECLNGRSGGGGAQAMMWADTRVGAALAVLAVERRRARERSVRSVQKVGRRAHEEH